MIVKVQRSITTTCEYQQILFYDEFRTRTMQFDLDTLWDGYFKRGELKFFAEVKWPKLHSLPKLKRKLPDQGW